MASYTFSIRGAWEVEGDPAREFETLEVARDAAKALIGRLEGDYPGAHWIGKPWRIDIADAAGGPVASVDAPLDATPSASPD